MHSITSRLAAAALLLVAASCASDSVVSPTFGAGCASGSLAPGQSKTGVLDENACALEYHFWSGNRVYYASYSVNLQAGRGYHFLMERDSAPNLPNQVDPLMTLYGKSESGTSIPLAISDDDAGGVSTYDSEFYFIAPTSGTYQLVTATYSYTGIGGYRVSMERCPVIARLDTVGVYDGLEWESSDCVRRQTEALSNSTPMVLIAVPVTQGQNTTVTVSNATFEPVIEIGGAGFDVFANIFDGDFDYANGDPSTVTLFNAQTSGTYTLAVGVNTLVSSGTFRATLARPLALQAPVALREARNKPVKP